MTQQRTAYATSRAHEAIISQELFILVNPAPPADWVMIIAGDLLQVPAVEAAHELGYKVLLTDRDPNCACASLVEEFVQLDTFDVDAHVELAASWRGKLAAVFTAGADPVVTVAAAAGAAGCHGLSPTIAEICANKTKTRYVLNVAKVSQPQYMIYQYTKGRPFDCEAIRWKYLVVKATSSSGSRGHTFIDMEQLYPGELEEAMQLALEHSGGALINVEEKLTGLELSVETLWHNGQMYPLNAVERLFKLDTCIELGHYNPAQLSQGDYQAVWDIMRQAGNAIGMNGTTGGHILKGDLILTDDGPKVLELTPRLSGGFDSANTSPASRGVNYIKGALRLALGQSLEQAMPDFLPLWHKHSVCLAVFSPQGHVVRIQGVQEARSLGCEVILRYNVGDEAPELVDCTQRAGFVIATDDTQELALGLARAARDVIVYEVE